MTAYHWLAAFVAVNVLDAALTLYGLKRGAYEANPLLRALCAGCLRRLRWR
jgi:hypothetical protein